MTPRDLLDPHVAELISLLPFEHVTADVLPALRVAFDFPPAEGVERAEHVVPGDPDISVRITRPVGATGPLPCVYSMHGGGYVMGSPAMDDMVFGDLIPELDFVGVSVDYRVAPETPYPGPLEDCYRGLTWTVEHADELGVDTGRLGVMGMSAGGGLAASLALLARDRGEVALAFQLLDCPMLDDRQITPSSQMDGTPVWSRESNTFGWQSYLGDLHGADDVPYTAAPARATDLSGLPPALISVGAVDGFRDEDIDYATRLNQAGVPTELHVYPGGCHAFQLAAEAPITKQWRHNLATWLGRQLHG